VEVPTFPKPATTVGYECRMLAEADEVELPEADGKEGRRRRCARSAQGGAETLQEVILGPASTPPPRGRYSLVLFATRVWKRKWARRGVFVPPLLAVEPTSPGVSPFC